MMSYLTRGSAMALVLSCTAHGALADVAAQDVWTDWQGYLSAAGYQITASESMTGGTLTVSDLSMALQLPEDQGTVSILLDQLQFAENGDGTVNVVMPPQMPITFDVTDGEEDVTAVIGLTQSGAAMVVSGAPDDMTYAYTSANIGVRMDSLTVDGDSMPPEALRMTMALNNVISSTHMRLSDMRSYEQSMTATSLTYDLAFDDPESEDAATFRGDLQKLGFAGSGSVPLEMDASDLPRMLDSGFGFDGRFTYASGTGNMSGTGDGEQFAMRTASQGGVLSVAMDAAHLAYEVSQNQSDITMETAELPFPIAIAMQKMAFALNMPIAKSDAQQPFAFGLTIADFTMPEQLWGIFDPGAILPRDPATIIVDLSGKLKLLADLLDPAIAETIESSDTPPGELHALTINALRVLAAGAELTGTGDFTFDNTDMESFDGIPAPAGTAKLKLVGANGLIDKLIQMGVMSDGDATGARMMMGMMAVPGGAPDTLNSTIEINDQGHILANGQRLK
ncbi:DUF2125 domain-containing protein [Antarcticimicrobium sediminis]|uniref:DUF2125 domain-containing protein n=1 Tax=Antarcticimicrobium sediminis TaxID=2546227 RepID=A0A4R5ENF4_9RHOB|nr:DUF2125 domain-containing protein [Antarcticimicrobium sediminis]TDE35980.1 DUF2125 domain-containing protein [Antarcticimicrobium sediminis]